MSAVHLQNLIQHDLSWRLWKALKDEAITLITSALYWKPAQRKAASEVLKEQSRRRKLQTLPLPVAKLLADLS